MFGRIGRMFLVLATLIGLTVSAAFSADTSLNRAGPYLPVLAAAFNEQWPSATERHNAAGQVEQESGWKERATLTTSRELGRGLTQMTIAYDAKGGERFNIYKSAIRYRALSAWDWQRDPYNVRYQLTFLVLQDKANFTQMRPMFVDDRQAWRATLVSYNAGPGRVLQRRSYARMHGIPCDRWVDGLDKAHGPRENVMLYGRPLWQAVNEYPEKVTRRAEKYRAYL